MIKRKDGKILNIASTAAFHPGPLMSVYYASKAYVLSFSEAIAEELKGTGVTVSALCPGPIKGSPELTERIGKSVLLKKNLSIDVAKIAKIAYSGLMSGKRVIIPGAKNKIFTYLARTLPRNLVTKFVQKIQESRGKVV
jgi:short-subunit dehydrogenase